MAHKESVSKAIQRALHDVALLKDLLTASTPAEANNKLPVNVRLTADEDIQAFWTRLTKGVMTMDARALADYYDSLSSTERGVEEAGRGKPQEWTP